MIRPTMKMLSFVLLLSVCVAPTWADSIPVANHSFEVPVVPEGIIAYPFVGYGTDWIELDNDQINGFEIGVFPNTPPDSSDHVINNDANQLAFFGGWNGNALLQDLSATYQVGKNYKMTVGVCVSNTQRPLDPNGLEIAFYYTGQADPNRIDIISASTPAPSTFSSTELEDHSVYLPAVKVDDDWVDRTIGIAIRAKGPFGGYWDLDNVRVMEYTFPNFTGDPIVNLADFAIMSSEWLSNGQLISDVTGDGFVGEEDLLILMEFWLKDE